MKKIIIAVSVLLVVMAVIYFVIPTKQKEPAIESGPAVNEFPNIMLTLPDGSQQNARTLKGKSILILYFPDCDHCQREATEISNHLKSFESYDVWFISSASFTDIERFAKDYKLAGYANVHFVRTEVQDVINNFGAIATPSLYIFSESKRFVKAFNGETKIEEILKYL